VDSKAECGQLNLAHIARNQKYEKETKNKQAPVPTLFGTGVGRTRKSVEENQTD